MIIELLFLIAKGIWMTAVVTALSLVFGIVGGGALCMMKTSQSRVLPAIATSCILIFRSVPPVLLLLFIFFGVKIGAFRFDPLSAAVVGLGLITAANMAETYRGALLSIHAGQWDAANALGISRVYRFTDIIGPQLLRVSMPGMATYAIVLLKESSLASTIGVQEIAFHASLVSKQTYLALETYLIAGLFYILMSIAIAWIARAAEVKMSRRVAR
ncbi:amino acid ABC transporter permease [Pelagibacterium sediminicola]|uniref:amino acid ABC transporter permease n=1 Tax=Pelagibacterium sediminicola TaxID=2248761 RepID=UPI000E3104BE|nr:amino acid ABC transporter permease [Pelagibacterium sediminicola]